MGVGCGDELAASGCARGRQGEGQGGSRAHGGGTGSLRGSGQRVILRAERVGHGRVGWRQTCFLFILFFFFSSCGTGGGLSSWTRCWRLLFFFSSCGVDGGLASGRAAGAERPDASSTVFRILIFQLQL